MVKTQDFQKFSNLHKIENGGQGFEQMQESLPTTFFRQLILRDTPCLTFRAKRSVSLRQSDKTK
jgi:hypothetical protein